MSNNPKGTIVEQLRRWADNRDAIPHLDGKLLRRAADEIERVRDCRLYVATFHGDIAELHPIVGRSPQECLDKMREAHDFGSSQIAEDPDGTYSTWVTPDPEDDKIEIWEYDPKADPSASIVWGFWGWHWPIPEGLEQGKMPGHDRALYVLAMDDY